MGIRAQNEAPALDRPGYGSGGRAPSDATRAQVQHLLTLLQGNNRKRKLVSGIMERANFRHVLELDVPVSVPLRDEDFLEGFEVSEPQYREMLLRRKVTLEKVRCAVAPPGW